MGTYSGPEVATDGLIFCSDMNNSTKSWKGMPSTNLIYDTTNFSNSLSEWQAQENVTVTKNQAAPDGVTRNECIKITCNSATDSYFGVRSSALTDGNAIHTFSCWLKANKNTTIPIKFGSNQYAVNLSVTPEWQYFSASCTANLSLSNYLHIGGWSSITDNTLIFFLYQPMYEKNTFATPFVSGSTSRSNTQALLDLTGQNTVTANSLTYNSDGTFTFATGVNYCTVSSLDSLVGDVTLEAVVNLGTANGPHQTAICTDLGYRYGIKLLASYHSSMAAWAGFGSTDYLLAGPNIQNTGNNHICLTRSSSTGLISLYRNGLLVASATTNTGNMSSAGSAQGRLGLDYHSSSYGFNGRINLARAYNRVLTADEVFQNFSATRSLYAL